MNFKAATTDPGLDLPQGSSMRPAMESITSAGSLNPALSQTASGAFSHPLTQSHMGSKGIGPPSHSSSLGHPRAGCSLSGIVLLEQIRLLQQLNQPIDLPVSLVLLNLLPLRVFLGMAHLSLIPRRPGHPRQQNPRLFPFLSASGRPAQSEGSTGCLCAPWKAP